MSDSDSAPEDVSFQQAKDDALGTMQGAAQAVRELKEKKKEARKRKLDFLKDQKAKKLARLKELESKKLPDSLLSSIESTTTTTSSEAKSAGAVVKEPENTVKTFHSDDDESDTNNEVDEARYEEVGSTQFSIVTAQDLNKFRNSTAWNFKQQMLFGSRVRREDHAKKGIQKLKQQTSCPSLKRPVKT